MDTPQAQEQEQPDACSINESIYLLRLCNHATGEEIVNVICVSPLSESELGQVVSDAIFEVRERVPDWSVDDIIGTLVEKGIEFTPKTTLTFDI